MDWIECHSCSYRGNMRHSTHWVPAFIPNNATCIVLTLRCWYCFSRIINVKRTRVCFYIPRTFLLTLIYSVVQICVNSLYIWSLNSVTYYCEQMFARFSILFDHVQTGFLFSDCWRMFYSSLMYKPLMKTFFELVH